MTRSSTCLLYTSVAVIQTVVNNDLLAVEVGVTERRCNIDDRTRLVALGLLCAYKALQMCQRKCEERALLRAYEHGAVAVLVAAGIKRKIQYQVSNRRNSSPTLEVGVFLL